MKQEPLEFIELPRGNFFESHDGFTPEWWGYRPHMGDSPPRFSVRVEGSEVARVELHCGVSVDHYAGAPKIDDPLGIHLFEISARMRRQGYGRLVVDELRRAHSKKRLVAFSQEADDFWSGIGWSRYDHPDEPSWYRPLFVAPLS